MYIILAGREAAGVILGTRAELDFTPHNGRRASNLKNLQSKHYFKMSLNSSLRQPNSEALNLSQQATQYLKAHASTGTATVPIPFLSHPESTDVWLMYEKLLLSCLRTGDDKAAHTCLEKLVDRFGVTNERVMGLRGLYQEAVAQDDSALQKVLEEYSAVLAEDPTNTVRLPPTDTLF